MLRTWAGLRLVATFSHPAELQLEGLVFHLVMDDVDAADR